MGLKEKIDIIIHMKQELLKVEDELKNKKEELTSINKKIQEKQTNLESLKTEEIELKDFINSKFKEQCGEYDYEVDITDCYVIELNGIKYIVDRICETTPGSVCTIATGKYYLKHYLYYNMLKPEDGKIRMFYDYVASVPSTGYSPFGILTVGLQHTYEVHILELFPELAVFTDNKVPNTYLQKIYYELNNLGTKGYIKEKKFEV